MIADTIEWMGNHTTSVLHMGHPRRDPGGEEPRLPN